MYTTASVPEERDPYGMILGLLMDRQCQRFSQVRRQRTQGMLRLFWKPLYGLYLDIEQTEYTRFNDFKIRKKPRQSPMQWILFTLIPPIRVPLWQFIPFACLWEILGQMIYHQSRYAYNLDGSTPAPNLVWSISLVFIVSIGRRHMNFY